MVENEVRTSADTISVLVCGLQAANHLVECRGKPADLVVRLDLQVSVEVTFRDLFGDGDDLSQRRRNDVIDGVDARKTEDEDQGTRDRNHDAAAH